MEEKEELLTKLKDAVSIFGQLSNVQQKLNQARGQYKKLKANKKFPKRAKFLMVMFGFWGIILMFVDEEANKFSELFSLIIAIGIIYAFYKGINILKNRSIDKYNKNANEVNAAAHAQEQAALNELQRLQALYRERLASWYPDSYCSLDAAEFFYNVISNYRADNLKEAINLYETTLHQRRVEDNQQQALKQQKLNNLLAIGNIAMQGATLGAINNQSASMQNAINQNTDAIRDLRNKL